jgi:hypothetical protein
MEKFSFLTFFVQFNWLYKEIFQDSPSMKILKEASSLQEISFLGTLGSNSKIMNFQN